MDKKKLVGTIVGVVFFVALIAGATFAWLTFTINVTNNTISSGSMNFSVSYSNGNGAITDVPILATATPNNATSGSHVVITANKVSGSAPGKLTLYLNTTTTPINDLIQDGAINYAVCVGTCTEFTGSNVKTGTITSLAKTPLLENTPLQSTETQYHVYFWLDGAIIDDTHIDQTYAGYISAEATQTDQ